MSLNQNIRHSPYNQNNVNNPHGLFNHLIVGEKLKGAGAPSDTIGTINSDYIDTVSGVEYVKNDAGVWEPFVDFGTLVSVPDPLEVSEVRTDVIKGLVGDSIEIDAGLSGDINLTLDGTNFVNVNSGNLRLQGNGNVLSGSDVVGFSLYSNNGAGKEIEITSNTNSISNNTVNPFIIENKGSGSSMTLKTEGSAGADVIVEGNKVQINNAASELIAEFDDNIDNRFIMYSGVSQGLLVRPQGLTKLTAGDLTFQHESNNASINQSVKGLGSHTFTNSTAGGTARIDANTRTLEFLGSAGDVNIRNVNINDHLLLTTDGTGVVKIPNGGLDLVNNPVINVDSVNGGDALARFGSLSVDAAGLLQYAHCQSSHTFCWNAVGGTATNEYGQFGGFTVAPGDVGGPYIPWAGSINMVSASLSYNSVWTFGAGTASIEIGYIATGLSMVNANFTLLTTLAIPTGSPFFQYSLGSNTNVAMPTGRLVARLNVAGSTPTSTNAEMVCTIWTN